MSKDFVTVSEANYSITNLRELDGLYTYLKRCLLFSSGKVILEVSLKEKRLGIDEQLVNTLSKER
jgi:hypothetical protein